MSFTVRPGEVTGYLGPNGSGKSTTVKIITALIEATSGKVLLDGHDIREDLIGFRRRLGYVPEEAILYSYLTGLEYLQLIGRLRGMPPQEVDRKANDLLDLSRSLLPARADLGLLERHEAARADLRGAAARSRRVDSRRAAVGHRRHFGAVLQAPARRAGRQGKTILYISHVLEVVERVCAQVIIIYRGRIMAADSVERLRDLMNVPSLEGIFAQLVEQRDLESVARDIVAAIQHRPPL